MYVCAFQKDRRKLLLYYVQYTYVCMDYVCMYSVYVHTYAVITHLVAYRHKKKKKTYICIQRFLTLVSSILLLEEPQASPRFVHMYSVWIHQMHIHMYVLRIVTVW